MSLYLKRMLAFNHEHTSLQLNYWYTYHITLYRRQSPKNKRIKELEYNKYCTARLATMELYCTRERKRCEVKKKNSSIFINSFTFKAPKKKFVKFTFDFSISLEGRIARAAKSAECRSTLLEFHRMRPVRSTKTPTDWPAFLPFYTHMYVHSAEQNLERLSLLR